MPQMIVRGMGSTNSVKMSKVSWPAQQTYLVLQKLLDNR